MVVFFTKKPDHEGDFYPEPWFSIREARCCILLEVGNIKAGSP